MASWFVLMNSNDLKFLLSACLCNHRPQRSDMRNQILHKCHPLVHVRGRLALDPSNHLASQRIARSLFSFRYAGVSAHTLSARLVFFLYPFSDNRPALAGSTKQRQVCKPLSGEIPGGCSYLHPRSRIPTLPAHQASRRPRSSTHDPPGAVGRDGRYTASL